MGPQLHEMTVHCLDQTHPSGFHFHVTTMKQSSHQVNELFTETNQDLEVLIAKSRKKGALTIIHGAFRGAIAGFFV